MVCHIGHMAQQWQPWQIGDKVIVRHCPGIFPLPKGLPERAAVKIVSFFAGYYDVEHQGRVFDRVPMACIEDLPRVSV